MTAERGYWSKRLIAPLFLFMGEKMNKASASFLAEFDELNVITPTLISTSIEQSVERFNQLLRRAYLLGCEDARLQLRFKPRIDEDLLEAAIFFGYADGESIQDKLRGYVQSGEVAVPEIQRLLESEFHRTYSTGSLDTAHQNPTSSGIIWKRWETMLDDKVRDTHAYLQGVTAPLDGEFFTFDGDSAYAPGLFSSPANNANCRCLLSYSRSR